MKKNDIIHFCAGGIIYQSGRVALLSDRYGRLVVPKGHIEDGETEEQAATREVEEETGYKSLKIIRALTVEKLHYELHGRNHYKIIHNFLFELKKAEKPKTQYEHHEIYKLVWLDLEKAINEVHFENTKTLLGLVKKFYDRDKTDS